MRNRYPHSLKIEIVTEFMNGATANELNKKYGVKQRTIYSWAQAARQDLLGNLKENDAIGEFLKEYKRKIPTIDYLSKAVDKLSKDVEEIKIKIN